MKLIERSLTILETVKLVARILKNTVEDLKRVRSHKAIEFLDDGSDKTKTEVFTDLLADKFQLNDECCAKPMVNGKVTSINCRKRK